MYIEIEIKINGRLVLFQRLGYSIEKSLKMVREVFKGEEIEIVSIEKKKGSIEK